MDLQQKIGHQLQERLIGRGEGYKLEKITVKPFGFPFWEAMTGPSIFITKMILLMLVITISK